MATFYVNPGDTLNTIVNAAAINDTIILRTGVHRGQTCVPKNGMIIEGEPGAVLNGSKLLTGWINHATNVWYVTGQTQHFAPSFTDLQWAGFADERIRGGSAAVHGRMIRGEGLWVTSGGVTTEYLHVNTLSDVNAVGRWFFDYAADRIYVYVDNPANYIIETADTAAATKAISSGTAFGSGATGVTIRNLTVEKYGGFVGDRNHSAALQCGYGVDWTIENVTARYNHAGGIQFATGSSNTSTLNVVRNCISSYNGQIGISGNGSTTGSQTGTRTRVVWENCQIDYNNVNPHTPDAVWNSGWEGGGSKVTWTDGFLCTGCAARFNGGPGLWTDVWNVNSTYRYNIVHDNEDMGIFHELSENATIEFNYSGYNWRRFNAGGVFGGQIMMSSAGSPTLASTIRGNIVVVPNRSGTQGIVLLSQADRGTNPYTGNIPMAQLCTVRDNIVCFLGTFGEVNAARTGVITDPADPSMSNAFIGNKYFSPNATSHNHFGWQSAARNYTAWQGFGNDTGASGSTYTVGTPPAELTNRPSWTAGVSNRPVAPNGAAASVVTAWYANGVGGWRDNKTSRFWTPIGNTTFDTYVAGYGAVMRSQSDTAGGAYMTLPTNDALYSLGLNYTVLWFGNITSMASFGQFVCVPYYVNSWSNPFAALALSREASTTQLAFSHAISNAANRRPVSDANAFIVGGGLQQVGAIRTGASGETCIFIRNGAQHGTPKDFTTPHVAPDFTNRMPVHVMQRHFTQQGEGATGTCYYAAIWNRALSLTEVAAIYANPALVFQTAGVVAGYVTLARRRGRRARA